MGSEGVCVGGGMRVDVDVPVLLYVESVAVDPHVAVVVGPHDGVPSAVNVFVRL